MQGTADFDGPRERSQGLLGKFAPYLLLTVLALGPRLFFWLEWNRAGLLALPVVDAHTFDHEARGLLNGTWPPPEPFWQAPLYSVFLAGVYRLLGADWSVARLVHALLGTLTCVMTWIVARRILPRHWAWVAFGFCALSGPLLYFEGQLLRETLATTLFALWVLVHLHANERRGPVHWAISGCLLGLTAACRENVLAVAPVVFLWGLREPAQPAPTEAPDARPNAARTNTITNSLPDERRSSLLGIRRNRWRSVAAPIAFLAGAALALAPITIWNWRQAHALVPISTSGGVNFYLGNNAESRSTLQIRPGRDWLRLVDRPVAAGAATPVARSRYFFGQALHWIASNPLGFLGNTLYKTAGFFSAHELKRNQDIYEAREGSRLLASLLWKIGPFGFPFGVIGPLALLGAILGARGRRGTRDPWRSGGAWSSADRAPRFPREDFRLLTLIAASITLAVILFFPTARYRVLLWPLMAVFAATALASLAVRWKDSAPARATEGGEPNPDHGRPRGKRMLLGPLAWLAGFAVLVNGGWVRQAEDPANQSLLRATALAEAGRTNEAIDQLHRATALDPSRGEAWSTLAALQGHAGRHDESMKAARAALAVDSTDAFAWLDLGSNLLASGDSEGAERTFRRALSLNLSLPEAWMNLAGIQSARADLGAAEASYRRALALRPTLTDARLGLVRTLTRRGAQEEARALLSEGLRIAPADAMLWFALGDLEGRSGRWPAAERALQRVVRLTPANADAWNNLGLVYLQEGRRPEAIRAFDRSLVIDPGHVQAAANRRKAEK